MVDDEFLGEDELAHHDGEVQLTLREVPPGFRVRADMAARRGRAPNRPVSSTVDESVGFAGVANRD
jgi:hypothetical protein